MSIKPQFAEAILDGRKFVEFRKRRLAPDVTTVLIYTTMPTGMVTGYFDVAGYDIGSPTQVWEQHKQHGGITRAAYREYFQGSPTAVGIRVCRARPLATPLRLVDLVDGLRAPQSFVYLDRAHVEELITGTFAPVNASAARQAA